MSKPILYTYWRSSCSWRVRFALNLKGVEYEPRPTNLETRVGEFVDECYKLNPAKKVPVLVHNGKAISESLAIIEYIDEVFPGPSFLPKDPVKKAQARAVALHVACGIQPIQNIRVLQYLNSQEAGTGQKWATYWLSSGVGELEELVKKTAGKYAVGDEVTIADICIPSILYNAKNRGGLDLSPFPTLLRIDEELKKLPAYEAATPEKQPDAPQS